ncbi:MAG: hypothetical protein KGD57_01405 [Candidatus Lokiarchaeota archaeon]|nr:hypothetical protein [Candidatus Lokiarchaeota archaeon]
MYICNFIKKSIIGLDMRARACLKCREYVLIHPDNPKSINRVSQFEKVHRGHTLIISDINEIKDQFTIFKKE